MTAEDEPKRIASIVSAFVRGSGSRIDSFLVAHDLVTGDMAGMSKESRISKGLSLARQRRILEAVLVDAEQRLDLKSSESGTSAKVVAPGMAASKLFISHAVDDKPLVEALVDLLRLGSDVARQDIVATSLVGMKPPPGVGFVPWIKRSLADAALVVEVITPAYWESAFCVCELGAQWGLGLDSHPLLAPGLDYADLKAFSTGFKWGSLIAHRTWMNYTIMWRRLSARLGAQRTGRIIATSF